MAAYLLQVSAANHHGKTLTDVRRMLHGTCLCRAAHPKTLLITNLLITTSRATIIVLRWHKVAPIKTKFSRFLYKY